MRAILGGFFAVIALGGFHAAGLWASTPSEKVTYVGGAPTSGVIRDHAPIQRAQRTSNASQTTPQPTRKPLQTAALSSSVIAELIIKQSRAAYHSTGRPCACPDDLMRNGRKCGRSSAYSRPGGASPKCYLADVTLADIEKFRVRGY